MGLTASRLKPRKRGQVLYDFLRNQTEDFSRFWLLLCDQSYEADRAARLHDPSAFQSHWLFASARDVEFYSVSPARNPPTHPPRLERALRTWDTCMDSVYVIFDRVCQRLLCLREVKSVEWIGVNPRPRLVLFWANRQDQEILREHDCIRITAFDGTQYVLDVSGWQFGYDDCFFSWEHYQRHCIAPHQRVKVRDPAAEHAYVLQTYADSPEKLEYLQFHRDKLKQISDKKLKELASLSTL